MNAGSKLFTESVSDDSNIGFVDIGLTIHLLIAYISKALFKYV